MTDVLWFFGEALRSRSRRVLLLAVVSLCTVLGAAAPSEAGPA
jgi:hypothetical protein